MTQVFTEIQALRQQLHTFRQNQKSLGLVPTMGALHQGHISLIQRAKAENDIVAVSIYVNPTQFNNPQDLAKYPRTLDADREMLEKAGCDLLFTPADAVMYPSSPLLKLSFGNLEEAMEGKHRKGHFAGVGLVVSKLFNIFEPEKAYFGQKDWQQCAVIRQMAKELFFDLEVVVCPTLREADGLAMSSRNRRLTPEQRQTAPVLYRMLTDAQTDLLTGKKPEKVKAETEQLGKLRTDFNLEYFEIADALTLQPVQNLREHREIALCIAAYFGEVRLIDNVVFSIINYQ
jgi:pantoate--beta-alanine ligase